MGINGSRNNADQNDGKAPDKQIAIAVYQFSHAMVIIDGEKVHHNSVTPLTVHPL